MVSCGDNPVGFKRHGLLWGQSSRVLRGVVSCGDNPVGFYYLSALRPTKIYVCLGFHP